MKIHKMNSWGRKCWSKQEKQEFLANFENATMTATEFARKHDLNPKTFSRWVREARKMQEESITFARVEIAQAEGCAGRRVEVLLPNQVRLLVPVASVQDLEGLFREAAKC
jgi:transposase-like protein